MRERQPEDAPSLPSGEALFQRYIEAIGGREAMRGLRNRVIHGTVSWDDAPTPHILTVYQQAPTMVRIELEEPGQGTTVKAYDGEHGWTRITGRQPVLLHDEQAESLAQTAVFHGEADPVVPVAESRQAAEALQAAGAPVRYTEVLGGSHNVWDAVYASTQFQEWLFAQRRAR